MPPQHHPLSPSSSSSSSPPPPLLLFYLLFIKPLVSLLSLHTLTIIPSFYLLPMILNRRRVAVAVSVARRNDDGMGKSLVAAQAFGRVWRLISSRRAPSGNATSARIKGTGHLFWHKLSQFSSRRRRHALLTNHRVPHIMRLFLIMASYGIFTQVLTGGLGGNGGVLRWILESYWGGSCRWYERVRARGRCEQQQERRQMMGGDFELVANGVATHEGNHHVVESPLSSEPQFGIIGWIERLFSTVVRVDNIATSRRDATADAGDGHVITDANDGKHHQQNRKRKAPFSYQRKGMRLKQQMQGMGTSTTGKSLAATSKPTEPISSLSCQSAESPRLSTTTKLQQLYTIFTTDRLLTHHSLIIKSNLIDAIVHVLFFSYRLNRVVGMSLLGPASIAAYVVLGKCLLRLIAPPPPPPPTQTHSKQRPYSLLNNSSLHPTSSIQLNWDNGVRQFLLDNSTPTLEDNETHSTTSATWRHLLVNLKARWRYGIVRFWPYNVLHTLLTKYYTHTLIALCAGFPVFFGSLRKHEHSSSSPLKLVSKLRYIASLVPLLILKWSALVDNSFAIWNLDMDVKEAQEECQRLGGESCSPLHTSALLPKTHLSASIKFERVTLLNPHSPKTLLIRNLSCTFPSGGHHSLVMGPQESGKTTLFEVLFRVSACVQPGSTIHCPQSHNDSTFHKQVFYISNQIYLEDGATWRDQLIWPDEFCECPDDYLLDMCSAGNLLSTLAHRFDLDTVADWSLILTEHDKQCLSLCRLTYHRARFAIFDDDSLCTFSKEQEKLIYDQCTREKTSVIRVLSTNSTLIDSHLRTIHEYVLQLNGEGGWQFSKLIQSEKEFSSFELDEDDF